MSSLGLCLSQCCLYISSSWLAKFIASVAFLGPNLDADYRKAIQISIANPITGLDACSVKAASSTEDLLS